jgi:hypothetical protein
MTPTCFRIGGLAALLATGLLLAACGDAGHDHDAASSAPKATDQHADEHDHEHGEDGHMHGEDDHDTEPLGRITLGEIEAELEQGHGEIAPGKELHLVVKLTPDDGGATVLRAWIGTEDRLSALVEKGSYAASHGDYDVHAIAPDPLPADAKWWIELERPDGTVLTGSIAPR